jgi:hypothetical protein
MDDRDKERIKFHTEILRLCVVILLTCGGGTITLILQADTVGKRWILITAGIFISVFCIVR